MIAFVLILIVVSPTHAGISAVRVGTFARFDQCMAQSRLIAVQTARLGNVNVSAQCVPVNGL